MRLTPGFAGLAALLLPLAALALETAPSRVIPVAEQAFAGSSINVTANTRSSIVTHSRTQFAAFYDADGHLVLAQRQLGDDAWQTRRTDHRANTADAHNSVSLAVDGDGFLHVSWGHHNVPLRYARSTAPLSLDLAAPTAMTGQRESRVTYPQFHLLPDGDLLFLYRDGGSGNGSLLLNRYDTATRSWSTVQSNLIDGEGRASPYWDLTVDRRGTLHLAWVWRDSPDVASNHDLCYARSTDGGVTWTKSDGSPLALPLTAANAEYALRIPTNSNLINPPTLDSDQHGRPYICSYWSPEPGATPRFQILYHDDTTWHVIPGPAASSSFTLSGTGTKNPPISRAALLVDTTWNKPALHLIYRDNAHGSRALLASRPGLGVSENNDWSVRELHADSLGAWEPAIDPILWRRLTQAHLLVQNVVQRDGNDQVAATLAATPIASLIWAPMTDRMRASSSEGRSGASDVPFVSAPTPFERAAMVALGHRLTDWQWAHLPAETSRRHPRGWEVAPFYIGVLALDRISPEKNERERLRRYADEVLQWQPHKRIYHADDHTVIQAYYDLYQIYGDKRMIAASKERFDHILANPSPAVFDWGTPRSSDLWSWCDALFMAPVAWLQLWKETGDNRYLDFMNREWWLTTDRLYLPDVGLYLRDESYCDLRERNGKTIHWSRGNGWVYAGLARVIDLFPRDHPDYPRYVQLFRDMTRAVLASQQPDGLWRVGMLDPDTHAVRETSGTAFFTFGLAWGVNRGLLDRKDIEPALQRAWSALSSSVTADGKLENVQPIGHAPEGFDPHHTDTFAVGALLLAISELAQLR
jgi:Predicted unsaturated glucuronyl hydrolase involved in regulation of bacterial surface properties, and related proteins